MDVCAGKAETVVTTRWSLHVNGSSRKQRDRVSKMKAWRERDCEQIVPSLHDLCWCAVSWSIQYGAVSKSTPGKRRSGLLPSISSHDVDVQAVTGPVSLTNKEPRHF